MQNSQEYEEACLRIQELVSGCSASDNGIVSDRVILASMGRSGSTLLANIINCENQYRVLFEPFCPDKVPEAREFIYPLYLRSEMDDPKYISSAKIILEGHIHSAWIDQDVSQISSSRILIKDIRANLFLKWLYDRFHRLKIVLLLRHPCAVVQSWMEHNFGDGSLSRKRILSSPDLLEDHVSTTIQAAYSDASRPFDRLIFFWCIYNMVPLKQLYNDNICVIFYENLFLDTYSELNRLFSYLNINPSNESLLTALSTPSSTAYKSKYELAVRDNVSGWRKSLTSEQVERAYEIMSFFKMDNLYCRETSAPVRENLHEFSQA